MKELKRTWKFTYWFEDSEWFEWETEITHEEEAIIKNAIEQGILLDTVSELCPLLDRVYEEISESVNEEYEDDPFLDEDYDPCEGLTVHFQDPNEPFYNIE